MNAHLTFTGSFGPEMVELVSKALKVPKNLMLIACPNGPFPHNVASLGGVRVITATHHQTLLEIDVREADLPVEEALESVIVDDGTSDGAVINVCRKALSRTVPNTRRSSIASEQDFASVQEVFGSYENHQDFVGTTPLVDVASAASYSSINS